MILKIVKVNFELKHTLEDIKDLEEEGEIEIDDIELQVEKCEIDYEINELQVEIYKEEIAKYEGLIKENYV